MTRLLSITLCLCAFSDFARAVETLLETGTFPGEVSVEIVDADGSTRVRMAGEPIVEVRENRFLRLRASPANDHCASASYPHSVDLTSSNPGRGTVTDACG